MSGHLHCCVKYAVGQSGGDRGTAPVPFSHTKAMSQCRRSGTVLSGVVTWPCLRVVQFSQEDLVSVPGPPMQTSSPVPPLS